MALVKFNVAVNMNSFVGYDDADSILAATPTEIRIGVLGDYYDAYYGTGFTFDFVNRTVTGGTATGFTLFEDEGVTKNVEVTGLSVSAVSIYQKIATRDFEGLKTLLLAGNDTMLGSTGNDLIQGYAGNDRLDGRGGADTMQGGAGDDIYVVRQNTDVVVEASSAGGTDLVQSYAGAHTLSAFVENGRVMATGSSNLTGNALDNIIFAGSGNNVLAGGAGIDRLSYAYATAAVKVSLATTTGQATVGSGTDTVSGFENLTGSRFADTLTGTSGANVIDGGAGNDTMRGGRGDDTYVVSDSGDSIVEALDAGTDSVLSSAAAHTLAANVENGRIMANGAANLTGNGLDNLIFAGAGNNVIDGAAGVDRASYLYAGSAVTVSLAVPNAQATGGSGSDTLVGIEDVSGSRFDDTLTGNGGANKLIGEAGNDTMNGGAGADTMTGGAGNDTFRIDADRAATDRITDFTAGSDRLELDNVAFTQLAAVGKLSAANFASNTAGTAVDANDYIVYDSDNGFLYYDADGSGSGAAVRFLTLVGAPALTVDGIFVI